MTSNPTSPRSGGELIVEALAAHGVDTVFGIPGTHNLGIFAALPGADIRNVTTRHEQGAGYAADGYARSTGRIGVAITTTGPAALNAATALGQAYSDSVPVLLIAPGLPTGHPSHGNGILHEFRDQRGTMTGVVAEAHRVESLAEIPVAIAAAFGRMRRGRPRPEYLEVPLDLLDAAAAVPAVAPLPDSTVSVPAPAAIEEAAEALAAASRVALIVGGGASEAAAQVKAAARLLDAAVISTTNGKGILAEDDPHALGAGTQIGEFVDVVEDADAVLSIGTELASADWWGGLPEFPATHVRIDVDPGGVFANAIPSSALVGDSAATLELLLAALEERTDGAAREQPGEWVETHRDRVRAGQARSAETWSVSLADLDRVLPDNAVIAADNAMSAYNGAVAALRLKRPRSFLFPTGAGTLGYGLPAGIGAKIADPDAPVVVIQGDGGIMFTLPELATAAEERIALPVIIYDNGGYGEIRNEMADRDDPVNSVALGSPDFAKAAEALGCDAVRLDDDAPIGDIVTRALSADRPTVIHVLEHSRAATGLRGGDANASRPTATEEGEAA
ncbi:thiamine pyrophosphate-binding protein [Gulosibacter sp. 10]|uniref:thiamine pyrophosphate-binding protein n=1 Tax=Gulosibacter sp. 10 TaxID=1255570 RepID=UPI00097F0D2E|nr:thiamine pyrophosphate-binding protein [Gulosibacter sp. 10]SJM64579.1 Acetolactate synthase large subunit [Gulosibacter sp. 10]